MLFIINVFGHTLPDDNRRDCMEIEIGRYKSVAPAIYDIGIIALNLIQRASQYVQRSKVKNVLFIF